MAENEGYIFARAAEDLREGDFIVSASRDYLSDEEIADLRQRACRDIPMWEREYAGIWDIPTEWRYGLHPDIPLVELAARDRQAIWERVDPYIWVRTPSLDTSLNATRTTPEEGTLSDSPQTPAYAEDVFDEFDAEKSFLILGQIAKEKSGGSNSSTKHR